MTSLSNIPAELKELKQWVSYKADKKPRNPHHNQLADVSDPSTWGTFAEALQAVKDYGGKGVGLVFTDDDPYVGIDLDKVIDDNGDIDPEAQTIVDRIGSYVEVSPSGHGLHIIVRASKTSSRCRKDWVEIYGKGRYFAFTGDLWQGRATIEDCQEALDWLCEETFGESEAQIAPVAVDDLVLDPDAEPPEDKLDLLLEDDDFKKVWEHRARLSSLSDYDWRLVLAAIEAGLGDQEIADLIIAFRRQHGKANDLAKALRKDYIPNTIAKARASQLPSGMQKLLTFKVVKLIQYGVDNSRFSLVIDDGREINMGRTEEFITPRLANARLLEAGLVQSKRVMDKWLDIVRALQPLKEIIPTTTRADDTRTWLDDYINSRIVLPTIESDDDIKEIFESGLNSLAADEQGRLYLRLCDVTRYSAVHSGMRGISSQSVAADLVKIGFHKRELRIKGKERSRQISIWISEPGFVDQWSDEE